MDKYDVIITGGSYSGLAAAMALGRALKKVLIIDSAKPCNIQTPHSHNFITQDGKTPLEILALAKSQVDKYETIEFFHDEASGARRTEQGFEVRTLSGKTFEAKKLLFATGIRDLFPDIPGYSECWGISVLHCPYCHGYEVKGKTTGILGNGEYGFEFSVLISNWTKDLTLFTNGKPELTAEQVSRLKSHQIKINESAIGRLEHAQGHLSKIVFKDNTAVSLDALYVKNDFEQHCGIPKDLGCEFTEEGYIKVEAAQKTSIPGVYACGDNSTKTRTIASAVAAGTTAGMMLNRELVDEEF